ncbi:30S ribosomal protein S9 [Candidatus Microgenomates bacterium]|nr:30S ribosomal protein S9 [Candidatus Microgenomates bacterium]
MPKETLPKFFSGYGRRKTATASVRLTPGKGGITVNSLPVEKYFAGPYSNFQFTEVFKTTNTVGKFVTTVVVTGSGKSGQAGATVLAIARALCQFDPKLKTLLRKKGFMTRDPRARQREKAGLMGARKQKQSPKR